MNDIANLPPISLEIMRVLYFSDTRRLAEADICARIIYPNDQVRESLAWLLREAYVTREGDTYQPTAESVAQMALLNQQANSLLAEKLEDFKRNYLNGPTHL